MPSMTPTEKECVSSSPNSFSSSRMMASPIGTIMMAVAVLETHMDRNAAATMKPSTIRDGPPPIIRMILRAIRRCRFHFSMVSAIMKPPRNSTIVLLK